MGKPWGGASPPRPPFMRSRIASHGQRLAIPLAWRASISMKPPRDSPCPAPGLTTKVASAVFGREASWTQRMLWVSTSTVKAVTRRSSFDGCCCLQASQGSCACNLLVLRIIISLTICCCSWPSGHVSPMAWTQGIDDRKVKTHWLCADNSQAEWECSCQPQSRKA